MFVDYFKAVSEFRPGVNVCKSISFNDFDTEIQSDEIASIYGWGDFFDEIKDVPEDSEAIVVDTI